LTTEAVQEVVQDSDLRLQLINAHSDEVPAVAELRCTPD
jgi:hypothetical protein